MTVDELSKSEGFCAINVSDGERVIESGYCGDFLSNVIGRAPDNCCWLTVVNNVNVAAVATLIDCAAVLLCEGVRPDDNFKAKAAQAKINVLGTGKSVFDASLAVSALCGVKGV